MPTYQKNKYKSYRESFDDGVKQERESNTTSWEDAYKEADAWLKTNHPMGKIIGYNHSNLIEYLSAHFDIKRK